MLRGGHLRAGGAPMRTRRCGVRPDRRPHVLPMVVVVVCVAAATPVFAKDKGEDDGDGDAKQAPTVPTMYLDMRTSFSTIPAGSLPIGLGNTALFTALESLALAGGKALPALPASLPFASRKAIAVDLPATVDVTDAVSLYAGVSGTTTRTGSDGWSSFDVTSWNIGFQADVYQQKGGSIPTVTWQSTITQSVPNNAFATTTFNNVIELDYAFDKDETRGLLAGVQDTRVEFGPAFARIHPNLVGYLGGYYQWPNDWKFTGRVGVQHFGGANILNLTPIRPFTEPVVRLDVDRMDDNDNRLFGVTAQIMWVPKPAYQLTLRTPLYAVRN